MSGARTRFCDLAETADMISRTVHNSRAGGFTLIEVLATLVLLGIALPVAMRGTTIALSAASRAKHTAEASALAESKLTELTTVITSGQLPGAASGDFAPDHPD